MSFNLLVHLLMFDVEHFLFFSAWNLGSFTTTTVNDRITALSLLRAHSRWGRQVPNNVRFTGRWVGGCHLTYWMNDFVLHGRVPVQTRESWGLGLAKQRCHRQWVKAASNFKCLAHHTEQCLVVQHNILDKQIKVLPLLTIKYYGLNQWKSPPELRKWNFISVDLVQR